MLVAPSSFSTVLRTTYYIVKMTVPYLKANKTCLPDPGLDTELFNASPALTEYGD